jgi:stalled ribosome rescue protein Dom34
MKFDSSKLHSGQAGSLEITITSRTDYPYLGSIIRPGDELETKIRTKDTGKNSSKKTVSFINAIVTVEKVVPEMDTINVNGAYRVEGGSKCGRTNVWLVDGSQFTLRKRCWRTEDIQTLHLQTSNGVAEPIASTTAVEARAMAEFRDLLATDSELLAFGTETSLYVMDYGAAKALLITEAALVKLPKEKQKQFTQSCRKFRGADVGVIRKSSEWYSEIQSFGGVIAILKYRFNPEDCVA